jgi:ribosomal-protein-alanine N-acetyltransferase
MGVSLPFLWIDTGPHRRIEGTDLLLRAPERGDYAQWAALREHSRTFLTPWEPMWSEDELTRSAFRRRLTRIRQERADDRGYGYFLFRRTDNALLGGLNLSYVRRGVAQTGTVGYWMGADHAGHGHMGAALKLALPYFFGAMQLHRLEAACLPRNERSIRLLTRCGFHREGLARAYLEINGVWEDHLTFALLGGKGVFA